jgi:tetratricopeptide (TPR) repeat protein
MTANQEAYQKKMSLGHSAAWTHHWDQAVDSYLQALAEFPDDPAALTSLALAYYELQRLDESLEYYQKATRVSPDDPIPMEKIALILEKQGKGHEAIKAAIKAAEQFLENKDIEKSISCWKKVINLQPDDSMAYSRLAMIYEILGQKREAVNEYLASASLIQNSGNLSKAIQIVEYCLKISPESQEARRAEKTLHQGHLLPGPSAPFKAAGVNRKEGEQNFLAEDSQERELDPITEGYKKAFERLTSLLFDQVEGVENPEKALFRHNLNLQTPAVNRNLSSDTNERTQILHHLRQYLDAQIQGNELIATEELLQALDAGLDNPAAYFTIGFNLSEKQPQKALSFLQKAVIHPDFTLGSYLLIGKIHFRSRQYDDAMPAYLRALGFADSSLIPSDQVDGFRQRYETIIENQLTDNNEKKQKEICESVQNQLVKSGWQHFIKSARDHLPIQGPDSPPMLLGDLLLETGSNQVMESMGRIRELALNKRITSALEEAFHAMEFAPTYLPLHIQVAEILLQEGRLQEATTKFLLVSDLYQIRGEPQQAIYMLMRVAQLTRFNLPVLARLIDLLIAQGNIKEAIQQMMNLANIHYQFLELDRARKTYASALRLAQQSDSDRSIAVQILYKLVDIDLQKLDIRQALKLLEQIHSLEPEDLNAGLQIVDLNFRLNQDNLAYFEIDKNISIFENSGKGAKAEEFVSSLLNERPEDLELRKRLADLLLRSEKVVQAVAQLDMIADAQLSAGNKNDAAATLRTIISLKPANLAKYQKALQNVTG